MTACDRCKTESSLPCDGMRVAGWIVYDGRSLTGKELKVRICPRRQRRPATFGKAKRRKAPRAAPLF